MDSSPLCDAVQAATGAAKLNAIGYCVGGSLVAPALAHMAAKGDDRINSVTFFATQVDFEKAGDLLVYVDEEQVRWIESRMADKGYLPGRRMADAFNLLRSNELIWSYVINNYLMGRDPTPFDLLYWNSDGTRMPANVHSFYLRECYLDNRLSQGLMTVDGQRLNLKDVKVPAYNLACRDDHIAPLASVFRVGKFLGGPTRLVVAGSGHIAGVVNPPDAKKYQHWTNDKERRDDRGVDGRGERASGLLVARLGGVDRPGARASRSKARPVGIGQARAARRCARQLRAGQGRVKVSSILFPTTVSRCGAPAMIGV